MKQKEQKRGCCASRSLYENRILGLDGKRTPSSYPSNKLNNQKYNIITFIPLVLYHQFKFFFNLFFLLIALSQFIKALRVGFLFTFIAPLAFVLTITMVKEAFDDIARMKRDKIINSKKYPVYNVKKSMWKNT